MRHPILPLPYPLRPTRSVLPTRNGLLTAIGDRTKVADKSVGNGTMHEEPSSFRQSSAYAQTTLTLSSHYFIGCIIIFGFLGNLLCLVVCRRSQSLRRSRFNTYLIGCSIADSIFLLCLGVVWLKNFDVSWHDVSAVCTASTFISNSSSFLSAWYVAAMTLELSTNLRNPYRIYTLFTTRRLLVKRVLLLALISLLASTWTLGMTRTVQIQEEPSSDPHGNIELANMTDGNGLDESSYTYMCHFDTDKEYVYRAFTIYEVLLSVAVPLTITVTATCIAITRFLSDRFCSPPQKCQIEESTRMTLHGFDGSVFQNGEATVQQSYIGADSKTLLHHFTVRSQPDADTERKTMMVAMPVPASGKVMRSTTSKKKRKQLMSPARYHAMLHRRTLERCIKLEDSIRPLLILKALIYLVCTIPQFIYRLSVIFGMREGLVDAGAVRPMVIIFIFYTQFALNAPAYTIHALIRRFMDSKSK